MAVAQHWWHGGTPAIPPGAARIYSLRKVNPAHTLQLIDVERDSDGTFTSIGFVGSDLDVATLAAFCAGTTGRLRNWIDQSGNLEHISTPGGTTNPVIYTGGAVVTRNGLPAVDWSGATQQFNWAPPAGTVKEAATASVIAYNESATLGGGVLLGGWVPGFIEFGVGPDAGVKKMYLNELATAFIGYGPTVGVGIHQFYCQAGSMVATQILGLDNTDVSFATSPAYGFGFRTLAENAWFGNAIWTGCVEEYIVYEIELTLPQRAALQANQKAYWGTP
tara:strand:+ start:613 stop:1443 length:831 start_codon:yes stop_codon:yes gene_type:complete